MPTAMDTAVLLSNPGCMAVADKDSRSVPIDVCSPWFSSKRLGQLNRLQCEITSYLGQSEKSMEKLGPSFSQIHWHMPLFLTTCVILG